MARLVNPTVVVGIEVPNTDLYVYHFGGRYNRKGEVVEFPCGETSSIFHSWEPIENVSKGAICRECLRQSGLEAEDNPPAVSEDILILQTRVESLERRWSELAQKAGRDD